MGQNNECIGVFMKVLRNEETMHQAIQSVLNQSHCNLKFYVLVSDQTKDILYEYAKKDERIKVFENNEKEGLGKFASIIIEDGNEYLTTIDGDDWYEEGYLEELLLTLKRTNSDISVCGYEFVYSNAQNVAVGNEKEDSFDISEIGNRLPHIYLFFRTIWGALFSKKLIQRIDLSRLPKSDEYGGYGGDTLYMFNALYGADKVSICPKVLYKYRVGITGTSRLWVKNRAESDDILFNFVCNFLREKSELNEWSLRFLYHVYGNAVIDTTRLLMEQKEMSGVEVVERLQHIYEKDLMRELLFRENSNGLRIPGTDDGRLFSNEFLKCIIPLFIKTRNERECMVRCHDIFELLFAKWKGVLSPEEFFVLLSDPAMLFFLVNEEYEKLFGLLLVCLRKEENGKETEILKLLKRITKDNIIRALFDVPGFTRAHAELLYKMYKGKTDEAVFYCRNQFSQEYYPMYSEDLLETWINMAALQENISEFIFAKEVKTKYLLDVQLYDEAKKEYSELVELGIEDEYIAFFGTFFG